MSRAWLSTSRRDGGGRGERPRQVLAPKDAQETSFGITLGGSTSGVARTWRFGALAQLNLLFSLLLRVLWPLPRQTAALGAAGGLAAFLGHLESSNFKPERHETRSSCGETLPVTEMRFKRFSSVQLFSVQPSGFY